MFAAQSNLTICGVMFTFEGPSVFGKSCFPTATVCGCTVTKDSTPAESHLQISKIMYFKFKQVSGLSKVLSNILEGSVSIFLNSDLMLRETSHTILDLCQNVLNQRDNFAQTKHFVFEMTISRLRNSSYLCQGSSSDQRKPSAPHWLQSDQPTERKSMTMN